MKAREKKINVMTRRVEQPRSRDVYRNKIRESMDSVTLDFIKEWTFYEHRITLSLLFRC